MVSISVVKYPLKQVYWPWKGEYSAVIISTFNISSEGQNIKIKAALIRATTPSKKIWPMVVPASLLIWIFIFIGLFIGSRSYLKILSSKRHAQPRLGLITVLGMYCVQSYFRQLFQSDQCTYFLYSLVTHPLLKMSKSLKNSATRTRLESINFLMWSSIPSTSGTGIVEVVGCYSLLN